PEDICAHAKRSGFRSVALTDTHGTYGFVEFHHAARKHEIKPIYGIVVHHHPVSRAGEDRFALTLLAVNREGLRHVASLASLHAAVAEQSGALDIELFRPHTGGIVAFMGGVESEVANLTLMGDDGGAESVIGVFRELFGERLFIEVQDHGIKEERELAVKLLDLAARTRTAPLLTQEVRYIDKGMVELYGTLRGIQHPSREDGFFEINRTLADWRMKTALEMSQLHPFYEAAYENTAVVDELIEGDLLDGIEREAAASSMLAAAPDARTRLVDLCTREFQNRYGGLSNTEIPRYRSIVEEESDEIVRQGISPVVLFLHDMMTRLRDARVDIGPATGLNLQSLCAYLLGITCFDLYRYKPDFHPAFLGGVREMREFEIQLTSDTRAAAMQVLFEMFDFCCLAYSPAVERITPARAVRMVSAAVAVPDDELKEIQRIIAGQPGMSLKKLYEQNHRLGLIYKRSISARDLLTRAALLEDLPSGFIKSRRSLALSPVPLTDFLGHSIDPDSGDLFVQAGRDGFPVDFVFRIDITSLGALGVAVRADEELRRTRIADYGWDGFSINDGEVWNHIQKGDATGVFLFEGAATQQQRESFELGSIDDLTNFLALKRVREGDQSLRERFTAYQESVPELSGEPRELFAVLKNTRGHIFYHEQLRDIIRVLTGISAADAWKMVNRLSAPTPGALSSVRREFMAGTADNNVPMDVANRWFEKLLYHSKTTMSRKRVFADALLVYKLFFLKTHHEAVFYAALLNSYSDNDSRLSRYLTQLRSTGLVLDLDANRSDVVFARENGKVRVGLCSVQGIERDVLEKIIKARGRGVFRSLRDFVERVGTEVIPRAGARRLIDAGAFDFTGRTRKELLKSLDRVYGGKKPARSRKHEGQLELPFD
ncbi:MAG: PHP domain-containing protein, partial [bacterium]